MMNSRKKRRELQKAHNMHWQDVYQLPLHLDKYGGYAWSANGTMALQFEYSDAEEKFRVVRKRAREIVDCINGVKPLEPLGAWTLHQSTDFALDGKYVFRVRGWGNLTGTGALHLPINDALRIQDEFVKYILEKLEGKGMYKTE